MTRIAIYPGSFDPPTRGHEDLVQRSLSLADELHVAVAINSAKQPLFTVEERLGLLRTLFGQLPRVKVTSFEGLLADYARQVGATMVVRGLRAAGDFEYELQMALMNRRLEPSVETVFLMSTEAYSFVSSRLVKEVASLGGNVTGLVPALVEAKLAERYPNTKEKQ